MSLVMMSMFLLVFGLELLSWSPVHAARIRERRRRVHLRRQAASTDCLSHFDGKHLIKIDFCDAEQSGLKKASAAFLAEGCQEMGSADLEEGDSSGPGVCTALHAICDANAVGRLAANFSDGIETLSKDAGAHFRKEGGCAAPWRPGSDDLYSEEDFYSDFRGHAAMEAKVTSIVEASQRTARLERVGNTAEGRPIYAVRITGKGYYPGKPKLLFTFNLHAREWLAGMAGVYVVEKLVEIARTNPSWFAGIEVVLVPMANPDGFEYTITTNRFWRKNRGWTYNCRGVDLDRNWPIDFGGSGSTSTDPCSENYIGLLPMSEPETRALMGLVDEAPLTVHVDVHTFGEAIRAPWSFTSLPHFFRGKIMELAGKMQSAILSTNYVRYRVSDKLHQPVSGAMTDFSTAKGAFGYQLELRPRSGGVAGFAPNISEIRPSMEECFAGLKAAITWAKERGR